MGTRNLFLVIIISLFLLSCGSKDDKMVQRYDTHTIQKVETDGWILVGNKKRCKLYKKIIDGQTIYWSICYNSYNSSVSK